MNAFLNQPRREWLRSCARMVGLAGFAGGGAWLVLKPGRDAECQPFPQCRGCGALSDCGLPQAVEARKHPGHESEAAHG